MLDDFRRLMLPEGGEDDDSQPQADYRQQGEAAFMTVFQRAQLDLAHALIASIHAQPPAFFEDLVIDLMLAIGYGARRRDLTRRLGRSGDGGVDGVIAQDELGLDLIYLQAKRLRPGSAVPVSDVRDFVGTLDAHRASKGVFVTTSQFTLHAQEVCSRISRHVSLIDGVKLAHLMIRYNIGVSVVETYQIKQIDPRYFSANGAAERRSFLSMPNQTRR